ncbi:complement receptor type 1 isoform X5 [Channa argus]|uniref:complement receptor type 1 isoform X5 n=1 Tax=Channa argus TaxID=215402 RepID=UPI00351FA4A1
MDSIKCFWIFFYCGFIRHKARTSTANGTNADCPKPEGSTNTILTDEALLLNAFPEGTKVSFECANGHDKEKGSEFITCIDGKWSELDLTCKRKDCGQPEPQPNMRFDISAGTLFGAQIRAICDKGYEIRGPSYMNCYNSGWGRKPRCEMVTCEKPTEVINGRSSWNSEDDPQYGEIINFSCNEGYTLVGKSSIVCSETGDYDSPPPKCEETSTSSELSATPTTPTVSRLSQGATTEHISTSTMVTSSNPATTVQQILTPSESSGTPTTHEDKTITTPPVSTSSQGATTEHTVTTTMVTPTETPVQGATTEHISTSTMVTSSNPATTVQQTSTSSDSSATATTPTVSSSSQAACPKPVGSNNTVLTNEALLLNDYPDRINVTFECVNGYVKEKGSEFITCIDGKWSEPDLTCKRKDCGQPEPQPNMRFDISAGTLFGDVIEAICDKGYEIRGPSYMTCYDSGWSRKPRCEMVTCEKPTEVINGRSSWNSEDDPKYGEIINFSCNEGYTLVGKATIVCSKTGEYDSPPPKCEADCPKPEGSTNTVLTDEALLLNAFPEGTKVSFECANGHDKEKGSEFITCIDGKWSELDLTCKRKDCGQPEPQPNMRFDISAGTLFGDQIRAICDKGYEIRGPSYMTCYNSGWIGKPRCEMVTCEKPTEVINGSCSWNSKDDPQYGEKLHFSCNEGYTLVGKPSIVCIETGEYDSPPPKCEVVTCEKPTEVINGRSSWNSEDDPQYGEIINFSCNEGYTLVGKSSIVCSETGDYDSPPPKCEADCPKPEGSTNTVLTDEALLLNAFPEGTKVSFECANGYVKEKGSEFITCIDGKWSELDLTCKRKDCGQPEPQPNMRFDISAGTLFGDQIRAICDKGYEIRGPSYVTCYNSGWGKKPRCEMVTCEKPTEVINGRSSWNSEDDPKYGEIINFSCNEGYTLVGKATIVCSKTGEYDSPPPKCEVVTCEKPTEVINGRSSWNSEDDPQYGEIINFSCNEGYTLVGNATIVCSETGEYDSQPPKCEADCPKPEGSTNTVLTDEALLLNAFPEGTKVSFECANGYVKEKGSEFITCIDGKWSEPDLTCKRKDCGQPEPQPNMRFDISAGTLFGDQIRAICDKGYELKGPRYMNCYNSGWGRKPRCEMVTCEKPTEVINGSCSWNSEDDPQYREIINFSCNEGYTLVGKSSIVCSETGEYDSPPPKCEGGRDMTVRERDIAATTRVISTTPSSFQEQTEEAEYNKNIASLMVVVGVIFVAVTVCGTGVIFHRLKKRGSYDIKEDLKRELLPFQNL